MTEYLTNYMKYIQERLEKCQSSEELDEIMDTVISADREQQTFDDCIRYARTVILQKKADDIRRDTLAATQTEPEMNDDEELDSTENTVDFE